MRKTTGLIQNVNDDRNIPAHLPEYALSNRIDVIISVDYDFYALSEISIKHLDLIIAKLEANGYTTAHMAYAPSQTPDMSFYHVLAYKNITCLSIRQLWFTASSVALTPETRAIDTVLVKYGEPYEKGTLIGVFDTPSGVLIVSVNHFGLTRFGAELQYSNECARMLAAELTQYAIAYPGATIIAGADFNAFDESNHINELLSLCVKFADITPSEKSFCAYPWDLGLLRPETKERILAARDDMKLLTGAEYIARAVQCLNDVYGGVLCSRIDRIVANKPLCVRVTMDMSKITLADFTESPFAPSDHAGYIIEC